MLYHGEASFEACSYHDVIGYIEYLKGRVRRLIDVKVEELKVGRRRHVAQCFCIHASPPVVQGYWRVLEIGYKKVAVILDQFATLIQQLFQHAVVVDESRDRVGEHSAIDLLAQCEIVLKNVSADKFELVDHVEVGQVLPCRLNHLGRYVQSVYFFSALL